jgi:hypothetical protein
MAFQVSAVTGPSLAQFQPWPCLTLSDELSAKVGDGDRRRAANDFFLGVELCLMVRAASISGPMALVRQTQADDFL